MARARQARRAGGRRAGGRPLRYGRARPDRRLRRLQPRERRRRPGRSARPARRSLRAARVLAPRPRRLSREPRPSRRRGHAQGLRGSAGRSTASASSITRWTTSRRLPGSASISPSRSPRKTDFAPYVAVAGAANAALSSEEQQICVEGLQHGERYAIVVRRACRRPSASRCSNPRTTKSTCAIARRRRISPARPTCCRGRASSARRSRPSTPRRFRRRLSRRRPQSHEFGDARRFSQTDFGLARERDREPGRREGLERRDGRRFRAEQGRRHRLSAGRGGGQIAAGRLSRHRSALEGNRRAKCRQSGQRRAIRWRRNGWSSPTSA